MDPHMIEWPEPAPRATTSAAASSATAFDHFVEATRVVQQHVSGVHVTEKAPAAAVYNAAVKGFEDVVSNAVNDTRRILRSRSFFEVIEVQQQALERTASIMMMHASAIANMWAMGPMASFDISKVANSNDRMRTDGSTLTRAANANDDVSSYAVA